MTFRDDHEAALARGEALDDRVAELEKETEALKAERDRLQAERDALAKRVPPEPNEPAIRPETRPALNKVLMVIGLVGLACALIAVLVVKGRETSQGRAAYAAAVARRDAEQARWGALMRTEPCARNVQLGLQQLVGPKGFPETWTPERAFELSGLARTLETNCTGGARVLFNDPAVPEPARAALAGWLAREAALVEPVKAFDAYLSNADWKEDGFAGAAPHRKAIEALLAARTHALAEVRRTALPALRALIRERQSAHERQHGRDETWWRIELGLALWEMNELSLRVSGVSEGKPMDVDAAVAALREPATAFRELATQAPLEVRRDVRKLDWLLDPLVAGQGLRPDGLWHLSHYDADFLQHLANAPPALPPVPPRPPDDD